MDVRAYIKERVREEDRGFSSPCWIWQLSLDAYGYAQGSPRGRVCKIHRFTYEELVGPIPAGLVSDHLCRNRNCVNPGHIEPVTNLENVRRGRAAQKWTHCKRGHELSGANLKLDHRGRQSCRLCAHLSYVERRAAARANSSAGGGAVKLTRRPRVAQGMVSHSHSEVDL
jgi:hypothetical protein